MIYTSTVSAFKQTMGVQLTKLLDGDSLSLTCHGRPYVLVSKDAPSGLPSAISVPLEEIRANFASVIEAVAITNARFSFIYHKPTYGLGAQYQQTQAFLQPRFYITKSPDFVNDFQRRWEDHVVETTPPTELDPAVEARWRTALFNVAPHMRRFLNDIAGGV